VNIGEEELKQAIIETLANWGLSAHPVPTAAVKTPDLRATASDQHYAIEIKQRQSDRHSKDVFANLQPEESASLAPLGIARDTASQSLTRSAVRQLRGEAPSTFRLLWVLCEGFDADTDEEQAKASLLGSQIVWCRRPDGKVYWCYFFGESDFWRYRADIDGAFVATLRDSVANILLLLNPYSPRYESLKVSTLVQNLGPDSVLDVPSDEAAGACLWADFEVDRRETSMVLNLLNKKYGTDLVVMPVHRYAVVVRAQ